MKRLGRRVAASVVLAGIVALAGVAPAALDRPGRTQAPNLDQLALPQLGRPGPDVPATTAVPDAGQPRTAAPRAQESVIQAAPARFSGPAPKAVPPPAALRQVQSQSVRQGGTWAVVIGVNDYPGTNDDLQSAVNDANDAIQALRQMGVSNDRILALRDGQANAGTVLAAVDWLANHAATDAVAVFFYAGHVRKAGSRTEEMVLSDGSAVTDAALARGLNKVVAARTWVAMAACYGGGFTEVLKPGRVLTGAAGADQLAYENAAIGRSYMVEYMVRQAMILERAPETVQTSFDYAVAKLRNDHPGREPVQFDHSDGNLSLRMPGVSAPSRQPEQAPPPAGGAENSPPPAQEPPNNRPPNCTQTGFVRYCQN